MRTPPGRDRIPARTVAGVLVVVVVMMLAGCSDDPDGSTEASIGLPATVVSSTTPAATTGAGTSAPASTNSTIPLPPEDTSDLPSVPPIGTDDIPVFTPPDTVDVPVYISVTVGVDDAPERIESVPLGASVTIDVLNPNDSDEFYLQGYDLGEGQVMPAGETGTLVFTASQAGDFTLESIVTGRVLLTLHVG